MVVIHNMEKANYNEFLKENKGYKTLKRCEDTTIIRLPNGDILKKLDTKLLSILENTGYNLETRLNEVDKLDKTINFAFPIMMLEDEGIVNSYTEPYILDDNAAAFILFIFEIFFALSYISLNIVSIIFINCFVYSSLITSILKYFFDLIIDNPLFKWLFSFRV